MLNVLFVGIALMMGTTAVSAIQNKRNFVGIDRSFEYLEISERRIENIGSIIPSPPVKKKPKSLEQITIFDEP